MKISGIYKIQSIYKPERIYVGSAVNISKRWQYHLEDLRKNKHHSQKLQRHFNKYGEIDLQFSILLGCDKVDLLKTEQYFIDSYNPYFNNCKIAGSQLGIKRSEETLKKMSLAKLGYKWTPESIAKRTATVKGQKRHPHSEETKRKIGEKSKGRTSYWKGKKLPKERILQLVNIHKGHPLSDEHKRKIGLASKGKKLTEEHCRHIKESWVIRKQKNTA